MKNTLTPIWDIPMQFKCPVIGACLTADEHRKILKRSKHRVKGLKSHQTHSVIMNHLDSENIISQKVDRYLKYKYRREIDRYMGLESAQFMAAWDQCFNDGIPEGVFLVAATRPDLNNEDLASIFGGIHMLSHANLHHVMDARRGIGRQKVANAKLAKLLKRRKKHARRLSKENAELKVAFHKMPVRHKKMTRRSINKKDGSNGGRVDEAKQQRNEAEIKRLKVENSEYRTETQSLKQTKHLLESEYFSLQATNEQLTGEINRLISQIAYGVENDCPSCDEPCSMDQVCARKVLLVGGMTKMKHFYRGLIESNGCEFDYHDGYISKGPRNLEARVKRAELILCPVDCNSHGACHQVKGLCKKYNKLLKILPSSSLTCISNALVGESPTLN
jgi:hypothetical protein